MTPKTVLLVEDDPDSRAIFSILLERSGYRVLQAENGAEGIRVAREERPDLILMNLTMPLVNGVDAIELLKSNPDTGSIPVVVLTGHMGPSIQEIAWEAGCDDYLLKPIGPAELVQQVRNRIGDPVPAGGDG